MKYAAVLLLLVLGCGDDPPVAPQRPHLTALDGGTCPLPGETPLGDSTFIRPCGHTAGPAICGVYEHDGGAVIDQWWGCDLGSWQCVEACP